MNKTEELKERIGEWAAEQDGFVWDKLPRVLDPMRFLVPSQASYLNKTSTLLNILKEARLVFTDYSTDDEGNIIIQGLEEIEVKMLPKEEK